MAGHFAILLRGVNVGGRNRLPMKDLVAALEGAGATEVTTLLQSGNALFTAERTNSEPIALKAMRSLKSRVGFEPRFTLRSAAQLSRIARDHPLAAPGRDGASLHVGFLASKPTATALAALKSKVGPDELLVSNGCELFIYYGKGAGRSRFTVDLIDRTLGTMCTMRNWNTACALAVLSARVH